MINKNRFDITKKEIDTFDRTVRRWNRLNCEEKDEVISRSLDRQIAEFCGVMGLKPAEVGRRLSIGRSTVKSRWERLQKRLRQNPDLQVAISSERSVVE